MIWLASNQTQRGESVRKLGKWIFSQSIIKKEMNSDSVFSLKNYRSRGTKRLDILNINFDSDFCNFLFRSLFPYHPCFHSSNLVLLIFFYKFQVTSRPWHDPSCSITIWKKDCELRMKRIDRNLKLKRKNTRLTREERELTMNQWKANVYGI